MDHLVSVLVSMIRAEEACPFLFLYIPRRQFVQPLLLAPKLLDSAPANQIPYTGRQQDPEARVLQHFSDRGVARIAETLYVPGRNRVENAGFWVTPDHYVGAAGWLEKIVRSNRFGLVVEVEM